MSSKHTKSSKSTKSGSAKKDVDTTQTAGVDSSQSAATHNAPAAPETDSNAGATDTMVSITLNRDTKARKSTSVVFAAAGLKGAVRISKSAFQNGTAPDSLVISSDVFATPKQKETKEERKARLAAAPKLTLAEKIAKREASLEAMRAKLAKAAPAVVPAS